MAQLEQFQMVINGKWVGSSSGETFESFNPFTAQPWALIPKGGAEDVDAAVEAAYQAGRPGSDWRSMTPTARGALLRKFGDALMDVADFITSIGFCI